MISELEKKRLQIGYKQVMRALSGKAAERVFLAEDCENKIKHPVEEAAAQNHLSVSYIATMRELGAMCGIDIGASCAVTVKN